MVVAQSTELRARRLTGRIGAEISGVDLGRLNDGDVAAIRQELLAHRVVFFRDADDLDGRSRSPSRSRFGPLTLAIRPCRNAPRTARSSTSTPSRAQRRTTGTPTSPSSSVLRSSRCSAR